MHVQKVVLAADHAGFALKEGLKEFLDSKGIEAVDSGTFSEEPVDYPAIVRKGCEMVLKEGIPGIVIGGSGNGEAMAANKMKGIRAAVCWNTETARLARAHNDANVLSLGARLLDLKTAKAIVEVFFSTDFEGERHSARVRDLDTPLS